MKYYPEVCKNVLFRRSDLNERHMVSSTLTPYSSTSLRDAGQIGSVVDALSQPVSPDSLTSVNQQMTASEGAGIASSSSRNINSRNLEMYVSLYRTGRTCPIPANVTSGGIAALPSSLEAKNHGTGLCIPAVSSVESPETSPSSTCSSPDYRWTVANGTAGGAAASPSSLSSPHPSLPRLADSPSSSPASSVMSSDYPRAEGTESAREDERRAGKIRKKRNRARPGPHDLVNGSSPSSRYSSPEHAPSGRRASSTPSTSPRAESAGAQDSQQNRETHRRGRPRADQLASLIIEGSTSPSNIKCSICNRVFPREKSRQAHERIHRGDKPYICDFPGCTKAFAQTGQLNTHQRLHTGEKPFLCSEPGCEVRFTHSNRHCPEHPTSMLIRSPLQALRPITDNVPPEVREWLEKYNRARNEKTPNRNKRVKSRKNLEIKSEQENVYGCKQQMSSDNEDQDSQDEGIVSKSRRIMKSRKILEMGGCASPKSRFTDDYNHNVCKSNESQDSQDESHDENQPGLQSEEDEMRIVSGQSIDKVKDVQKCAADAILKSENEELEEEINDNLADRLYSKVQAYQDEDIRMLPVTPSRVFQNEARERYSPASKFEDEQVGLISPSTPLCRPVRGERYSELDSTLESETEEPSSTSIHQQLLITPVRNSQNCQHESQYEASPSTQSQEPDTTYQLPSTPVSRPSQCLPLKKRWGCMSTQHEAQTELQNQPLAQPIRWDMSPYSQSTELSDELHCSAQWCLSRSQQSFTNQIVNDVTAPNVSSSSHVRNELVEKQLDDALPKPNIETQGDQQDNVNIPVATDLNRNVQSVNECRASVLRHVGRINYSINDPSRPNFSIHEVEPPTEVVVNDIPPIEQVIQEGIISTGFTVEDYESQAIMALLDLGTLNKNSKGSHEET